MAESVIRDHLWRTLLSLPPALLRAASGGRAVHLHGRTLDPRFQVLIALVRQGADPASGLNSIQRPVRAAGGVAGVREQAVSIDGARGTITARLLTPVGVDRDAPMIVYAAGAAIGAAIIAAAAASRVLLVPTPLGDGRGDGVAEGRRFPAGFDDLLAAYAYARETAAREGADANPAIGGESVGGGMAAAACLELKRLGLPQPRLQLLIYPALDMTTSSPPGAGQDAALLAPDLAVWLSGRYIGPTDDPLDPRVSPLRVKDPAGLAPAVIVGAGYDPLAEQAAAYARKLRAARGGVVYRAFDHLPHGFLDYAGLVETARTAAVGIGKLAGAGLRGDLRGGVDGDALDDRDPPARTGTG